MNIPSKVSYADKKAGDKLSSTEFNELKNKFNSVIDYLNSLSTTTPTVTTLSGKTQLFFLGDSITFGVATTYGFSYPQQVMTRLNDSTKFTKVQRGFSGQSAAWFNQNELQNTINMFNFIQYNNVVCVVYFGTNDLPSIDVETFKTNILATYTALKNAGAKVIIVPVLNRTDRYSNASYDTRRLAFNEYAYANYRTIADGLADMKRQYIYLSEASSNSAFIAAGDPDGLTGVHPNNRGAACIAEEVAQAIATLHGISLPAVAPVTATYPTQFGTQPPNNGISSGGVGNGAGLPLDVTPSGNNSNTGNNTSSRTYQPVQWVKTINATVTNNGNTITKTSGADARSSDSSWDASGQASFKIDTTSGIGEKGAYKLVNINATAFANNNIVTGFTSNVTGAHYRDLQFAWYVNNNSYNIIESGSIKYTVTDANFDVGTLEIVATDSQVKYYAGDILVYTSTSTPSFPLIVKTSIMFLNDGIVNGAGITGVNLITNS